MNKKKPTIRTTRTEYNKRLLALAAKLEKLPPERFKFSVWVGYDWRGKADLSCGTSACAMGWATTMPRFRALGLRLKREDGAKFIVLKRTEGGEAAAMRLFGLSESEANYLFIPEFGSDALPRTATAAQVAARIREFVELRGSAKAKPVVAEGVW